MQPVMRAPFDHRNGWFVALITAVALGVATVVYGWFRPTLVTFCASGCMGAVAGAASVLLARKLPRGVLPAVTRPWQVALLGASCSALTALLVGVFGMRHFGGFDHSVVVDLAWRLYRGQRPFVDFTTTVPVGFMLGCGYAFSLFGTNWSAIVAFQALFAGVTSAWVFVILVRVSQRYWLSAATALAIELCINAVTAYWWYNSATSTLAVLYLLSAIWLIHEPRSPWGAISYVASLLVFAAMKPNMVGLLIPGLTIALGYAGVPWRRVAFLSLLGFAGFAGWMTLAGVPLVDLFGAYASVARRGFDPHQFLSGLAFPEKAASLVLYCVLSLAVVAELTRCRRSKTEWAVAIAGGLAATSAFVANGENKLVDLPVLLVCAWYLSLRPAASNSPKQPYLQDVLGGRLSFDIRGVLALFVVAGLTTGALRARVRSIGPGCFFEFQGARAASIFPLFRGLESGPKLVAVEKEVDAALATYHAANPFFGPRMQWGYAALGFESPRNQPVWWHAGVSYPKRDEPRYAAAWLHAKHDVLILLRDDFTELPEEIRQSLKEDYEHLSGFQHIGVYLRRTDRVSDGQRSPNPT